MQAIREIRRVKNSKITLELPHSFENSDVEVIVLPLEKENRVNYPSYADEIQIANENSVNLAGALKKYADASLIDKEKEIAWNIISKEVK